MSGFFRLRSPEQIEQDAESFAVEDTRLPNQIDEQRAVELLIGSEEADLAAAQLLALARLLRPDAWVSRESFLEMAERERSGSRANEPAGRRLVASYRRAATSSVAYSIRLAQEAAEMVRGWR